MSMLTLGYNAAQIWMRYLTFRIIFRKT